jgi:hypothetical protein
VNKHLILAALVAATLTATPVLADGPRDHSGGLSIEVACGDVAPYYVHAYEVYHVQTRGDRRRLKYRVLDDNSELRAKPKGCKKGFKPFVNTTCDKVFHVISDVRGAVSFQLAKSDQNRCDG